MATKTVSSWSNALDGPGLFDIDAPNDDQCGLLDVGAPSYDQRGPFAPNDNQCAPDESVVASPESFELTDPADAVPDNAAKGFGRSASLDAAGSEQYPLKQSSAPTRQRLRFSAVPPQFLPLLLASSTSPSPPPPDKKICCNALDGPGECASDAQSCEGDRRQLPDGQARLLPPILRFELVVPLRLSARSGSWAKGDLLQRARRPRGVRIGCTELRRR